MLMLTKNSSIPNSLKKDIFTYNYGIHYVESYKITILSLF